MVGLCCRDGEVAIEAIMQLAPSPERDALVHLVAKVVNREY